MVLERQKTNEELLFWELPELTALGELSGHSTIFCLLLTKFLIFCLLTVNLLCIYI